MNDRKKCLQNLENVIAKVIKPTTHQKATPLSWAALNASREEKRHGCPFGPRTREAVGDSDGTIREKWGDEKVPFIPKLSSGFRL